MDLDQAITTFQNLIGAFFQQGQVTVSPAQFQQLQQALDVIVQTCKPEATAADS